MRLAVLLAALIVVLGGCSAPRPRDWPAALSREDATRRAGRLASVGARIFADPSLSASGRLSCASCHSPSHAFGPPDARAARLGGPALDREGARAVPSLRYLQVVPAFAEHFFEAGEDVDDSVDAGPTGGLMWDGRVDRGRDQALLPLLSPAEMAGGAPVQIAEAASRAPYADDLRALFGPDLFRSAGRTLAALGEALEVYQQTPDVFYPYSSKYDASLAGLVTLSPQERRGRALFEDPAKGNCARCHISRPDPDGTPPQFTDYGLVAIGVPRNRALQANADLAYFDLGLCGPLRADFRAVAAYCGRFRTPTLRNAAVRQTFFHNGVVHSLRDAVAFYAERDTRPERWYGRGPDGRVEPFDDLPARYRGNIDRSAPFGGRPGGRAVLTPAEIDDIVAFIGTLTDRDAALPMP
jgi:cytochrome c peroxidase